MVDYTMIAQTPYISIPEIGNALIQRQQMENNPLQQMRHAQALEQEKIQNRILFMQEQQAANAEKVRRATVEAQSNVGIPEAQANAIPTPPPAAANAFTGTPGPPAAASAQETGVSPSAPAVATPPARIPYSPEAEGQYKAREGARMEAMKEARDTFKTLLKSAVDTGSPEMVDSLLRVAKKSNALRDVVGFLGDPDGPENQKLVVTGKGETQTESAFSSKEQLATLLPMAGNDVVKKAIENAAPGNYEIKTKGYVTVDGQQVPKIVGFKSTLSTEAAHTSDIGKYRRERDARIAELVSSGMTREEALKDGDVKAYSDKIAKSSEPKPEAARDRYLNIMKRAAMNDPVKYPVTEEERKEAWAYERERKLTAEEYGKWRLLMIDEQPASMYDTNTGNIDYLSKGEIKAANRENNKKGLGARYVGAELATKLKSRNAIMEEIATSSEIARKALKALKHDSFSQTQLLKFADQLRVNDDGSMLKLFISSNFAKTLSPAEIEYVTAIRNLRESSFSLRTVGGMGQGSDMLRAAISEMIPGPRTPNKKMGLSALDKFDIQVDRLWSGIPGIGSEATTRRKGVGQAAAGGDIAPAGTKIKTKDGKVLTSDGLGGWK